jgi:hypothetical protein
MLISLPDPCIFHAPWSGSPFFLNCAFKFKQDLDPYIISEEVVSLFLFKKTNMDLPASLQVKFIFLPQSLCIRIFFAKILCIYNYKNTELGGIIFSCKIRQDWLMVFSDSSIIPAHAHGIMISFFLIHFLFDFAVSCDHHTD